MRLDQTYTLAGTGAYGASPGPATKTTVVPSADTSTSAPVTIPGSVATGGSDGGVGHRRIQCRGEGVGEFVGAIDLGANVATDLGSGRPHDRRAVERRRRCAQSYNVALVYLDVAFGRRGNVRSLEDIDDAADRQRGRRRRGGAAVDDGELDARTRRCAEYATTHPLPLMPGAALLISATGRLVSPTRSRIHTVRPSARRHLVGDDATGVGDRLRRVSGELLGRSVSVDGDELHHDRIAGRLRAGGGRVRADQADGDGGCCSESPSTAPARR